MHHLLSLARPSYFRHAQRWSLSVRRAKLHCTVTARAQDPALETNGARSRSKTIISKTKQVINTDEFDRLMLDRLFFVPAFKPYQGVSGVETRGLYNYGPPGANLQDNVLDVWRKHFILEEDMLKVDCPVITPYEVLKTSGHVDQFTDFMCKDAETGEHYRADHVVKEELSKRISKLARNPTKFGELQEAKQVLSQLDNYNCAELGDIIHKHNITSPMGNKLEAPVPINLMFETALGPSGKVRGYLRPETAQGQILMFKELWQHNGKVLPFASASIGKSYRNEISPKSGILRVREFLMAEIEHYMDPDAGKEHPRFGEVADIELPLLTRTEQMNADGGTEHGVLMSVGRAVESGIVDNETLGYFLARSYLFLLQLGIDPGKLRFRQHMAKEMAHYATDCWDIELSTSWGWIECVGLADRSAYDITAHDLRTGSQLAIRKQTNGDDVVELLPTVINHGLLNSRFKTKCNTAKVAFMSLSPEELKKARDNLERDGRFNLDVPSTEAESGSAETLVLDSDIVCIRTKVSKAPQRQSTPNIIEPSFGIGRILYALMEHSIERRPGKDKKRLVLALPPGVAPTQVAIMPLSSSHPMARRFVRNVQSELRERAISTHISASGASIGKRYSRTDEIGTPLCVTIDLESFESGQVTLRDRDSTEQVRSTVKVIVDAIEGIVKGKETWAEVCARLPRVERDAEAVVLAVGDTLGLDEAAPGSTS